MVAGDAGIGKTTLVADLEQRAETLGFAIARGQCLDIEAEMPARAGCERGAHPSLPGRRHRGTRPHARRMLDVLDPSPRRSISIRLLDDLRLDLPGGGGRRAGADAQLEDLHWADRSTQELVTALARTASGRMFLIVTFRTDDLPRRHPFRTALAEIGRAETARTDRARDRWTVRASRL